MAPAPTESLTPGSIHVGAFSLSHCLGEGGMGSVWSGVHRASGQPVAVKLLKAELAGDPWFLRSFAQEVRAVAGLDHPSIVTLLDHGHIDEDLHPARVFGSGLEGIGKGSPWLAMEPLKGDSLNVAKGRTSWTGFVRILRGLLGALAHAHARGVLHRDIKPANVIDTGDRVVLLDFGLARAREESESMGNSGVIVGTATYMAPEQFRGADAEYGPWTDLYGVGALGWALLAGTGPFGRLRGFAAQQAAHCEAPLPRLVSRQPVPREAEAFLRRMLEKRPEDRYRFAADALDALERLARVPLGGMVAEPERDAPEPLAVHVSALPREWPAPPPRRSAGLMGAGLRLFGLRKLPLVGRHSEQRTLWDALRQAERGPTPVVLLRGPAGTGKSSLVRWLAEEAHRCGAADSIWAHHGEEPGASDGIEPALVRWLRCSDPKLAQAQVDGMARRWALDDHESRALALLVRGPSADGRTGFSSTGERHAATLLVLRKIAQNRPIIMVLDDVQWGADALSFALHLLARPVAEQPRLLLVLTSREVSPGTITAQLLDRVMRTPDAMGLELGPLPPGYRGAMVQEMLRVSGRLATAIEERTEGNPLFMVQLVEDWIRRKLLIPGNGGFVLQHGADPTLPLDLREVWRARVDQALAHRRPTERQAIELAAILGMRVDTREWMAAGREAGAWPSLDLLEDLLAAGLAEPAADGPEQGWSFVHGMLRETLVADAERSGWARTARLACVAELTPRAATDARTALRLGRLHLALGDRASAIGPLSQGAWSCVRDSEYLRADLVLADRERAMGEARLPEVDPRWGEGWLMQARVARRRGDAERAASCTRRLLEAAATHGWHDTHCQALREASRLAELAGHYREARKHARTAADIARRLGEAVPLAWCRRDLGLLLMGAGARLTRIDPLLAAAQDVFSSEGEGFGAATCMRARGEIRLRENHPRDAAIHLHAARGAFRKSLRVQEPAHSQVGLGDVARLLGHRAEARRWYRAARERFTEIGHPGPPRLTAHHAQILLELGQLDEAEQLATRALSAQVRAGSPETLQLLYALRAAIHGATGDLRAAHHHLTAAAAETDRPEGPDPEALIAMERIARAAASRGDTALDVAARSAAAAGWTRLGWGWRARLIHPPAG